MIVKAPLHGYAQKYILIMHPHTHHAGDVDGVEGAEAVLRAERRVRKQARNGPVKIV